MFKIILPMWMLMIMLSGCDTNSDEEGGYFAEAKKEAKKYKDNAKKFNDRAGELSKTTCDLLLSADSLLIHTCYYVVKQNCGSKSRKNCLREVLDCKSGVGKYEKYHKGDEGEISDTCYPRYEEQQKRFGACIFMNMLCEEPGCSADFVHCLDRTGNNAPKNNTTE